MKSTIVNLHMGLGEGYLDGRGSCLEHFLVAAMFFGIRALGWP